MNDRVAAGEAKPRCLTVGQHRLVLDCLHLLLQPAFKVRSAGDSVEEALTLAQTFDPQIAILDWPVPKVALELARRLREVRPGLATVLLSDEAHPRWSTDALSKSRSAAELVHHLSVRTAALSTRPSGSTARGGRADGESPPVGAKLSQRELQVLVLLVRGLRMKEVARLLHISPRTVAFHKYRVMENNQLRSQADLLNFVLRHGLLSAEPPDWYLPVLSQSLRGAADARLAENSSIASFGRDRR